MAAAFRYSPTLACMRQHVYVWLHLDTFGMQKGDACKQLACLYICILYILGVLRAQAICLDIRCVCVDTACHLWCSSTSSQECSCLVGVKLGACLVSSQL